MAVSGKGRGPLVADRRYSPTKQTPTKASGGGSGRGGASGGGGGPRKPAPGPKRPPRKRGPIGTLFFGFFGLIWRIVWGIGWRIGFVTATILAAAILYFYAQLPAVTDLIDARARGSVTLLDRDNKVFAWRGETFGGMITAETVSPFLHDAVVATEDRRFYRHFGISPRGIASANPHQPCRRARPARRQRWVHHHAAGGQIAVPWRAL